MLRVSLFRNEPGPAEYGSFRSFYAPAGGTSHPTYEGTYRQAPMSRWVQPGMSVGYNTSQQPFVDPSSCSEYVSLYSVRSTNEPYPLGFRPQRNMEPMNEARPPSQNPANVQSASNSGGSYNRTGCTTIASTSGPFTRTTFFHLLIVVSLTDHSPQPNGQPHRKSLT